MPGRTCGMLGLGVRADGTRRVDCDVQVLRQREDLHRQEEVLGQVLEGATLDPNNHCAAGIIRALDERPSSSSRGLAHAEPNVACRFSATLQQRQVGGSAPRRPRRPVNKSFPKA